MYLKSHHVLNNLEMTPFVNQGLFFLDDGQTCRREKLQSIWVYPVKRFSLLITVWLVSIMKPNHYNPPSISSKNSCSADIKQQSSAGFNLTFKFSYYWKKNVDKDIGLYDRELWKSIIVIWLHPQRSRHSENHMHDYSILDSCHYLA